VLSLGSQAGASDPDSLASKLADSSVSESPPLCVLRASPILHYSAGNAGRNKYCKIWYIP
jgi:hypothetical protein